MTHICLPGRGSVLSQLVMLVRYSLLVIYYGLGIGCINDGTLLSNCQ